MPHAVPPLQHGWPTPPQLQTLLTQASWVPLPHGVAPLQHGWPLPPQVAQLPPEHTVPLAVQAVPLVQQI